MDQSRGGDGDDVTAAQPTGGSSRRGPGRATLALALVALACVGYGAVQRPDASDPAARTSSTVTPAAPVTAPAPTAAPVAALHTDPSTKDVSCVAPETSTPSSTTKVTEYVDVDSNPSGATLEWLPGLNSTRCASQLTTLNQAQARQLAKDLQATPYEEGGVSTCGGFSYGTLTIYLTYPGKSAAELVTLPLDSCSSLGAPDRFDRHQTTALLQDLHPLAPADWAPYFAPHS